MTGVKSWTLWVTLRIKRPRIWTQPTQFQILSEIFKSEFPGNWIKLFISPESAWFTESVPIIGNKKTPLQKSYIDFNSRNSTYLSLISSKNCHQYDLATLLSPIVTVRTLTKALFTPKSIPTRFGKSFKNWIPFKSIPMPLPNWTIQKYWK